MTSVDEHIRQADNESKLYLYVLVCIFQHITITWWSTVGNPLSGNAVCVTEHSIQSSSSRCMATSTQTYVQNSAPSAAKHTRQRKTSSLIKVCCIFIIPCVFSVLMLLMCTIPLDYWRLVAMSSLFCCPGRHALAGVHLYKLSWLMSHDHMTLQATNRKYVWIPQVVYCQVISSWCHMPMNKLFKTLCKENADSYNCQIDWKQINSDGHTMQKCFIHFLHL